MADDRKCDLGEQCQCESFGVRDGCTHFHMPMPKILSPRARSSFQNDLRDQGEGRIKQQPAEGRERVADSRRQTADLVKRPGALQDWQRKEQAKATTRVAASSLMNDPSEGTGHGTVRPGGVKMR